MGTKGSASVAKSPSPAIDKYEAESAASTLMRADEIRRNTPLYTAAQKHARKQMRGYARVAGMSGRTR